MKRKLTVPALLLALVLILSSCLHGGSRGKWADSLEELVRLFDELDSETDPTFTDQRDSEDTWASDIQALQEEYRKYYETYDATDYEDFRLLAQSEAEELRRRQADQSRRAEIGAPDTRNSIEIDPSTLPTLPAQTADLPLQTDSAIIDPYDGESDIPAYLRRLMGAGIYQIPAQKGENASADGTATDLEPYWKKETNPLALNIMTWIDMQLMLGATYIDLSPLLKDKTLDPDQFIDDLSAMFFTVRDSNPAYFYYDNIDYIWPDGTSQACGFTYNYRYLQQGNLIQYTSFVLTLALKPGMESPAARTKAFREMEDEATRVAQDIMRATPDDYLRLRLAHDYLADRTYYSPEHDFRTNNAQSALLGDATMCVGYSLAYKMIVERMGFPCISVYGNTRYEGGGELHNWNKVKFQDTWYNVDVTWDDPGPGPDQSPPLHNYFLRSDLSIADSHIPLGYAIPSAPEDYMDYWTLNDLTAVNEEQIIGILSDFIPLSCEHPESYNNVSIRLFMPLSDERMNELCQAAIERSAYPYGITYYYRIGDGVANFYCKSSR
jgi:hypothetical protein